MMASLSFLRLTSYKNDGVLSSVRVAFPQHLKKCLQQYVDVKPKAPVVDVPEIQLHTLGDVLNRRRGASRSVALSPSRHARLDVMSEGIIGDELLEIIVMGQRVRTRADQGHIAF